jgi:S-DNA-T family DNA segregation ATPase FtsK/SpoIIIE
MVKPKKLLQYQRELISMILMATAFFVTVSLVTYNSNDHSLIHTSTVDVPIANACGLVGAYIASIFFYFFGCSSYIAVMFIFFIAYLLMRNLLKQEIDRLIALIVLLITTTALCAGCRIEIISGVAPGGVVGTCTYAIAQHLCDTVGAFILFIMVWLASLVVLFRVSILSTCLSATGYIQIMFNKLAQKDMTNRFAHFLNNIRNILSPVYRRVCTFGRMFVRGEFMMDSRQTFLEGEQKQLHDAVVDIITQDEFWHEFTHSENVADVSIDMPVKPSISNNGRTDQAAITMAVESNAPKKYQKPMSTLFVITEEDDDASIKNINQELQARAKILEEKLTHFGVHGTVVSISRGPVVTLFEYQPAIDIKVSKILALADDLSLALQAMSIRILAPIPGKSVVGFEVANRNRKKVSFTKLLTSPEFEKYSGSLPIILGEDTVGKPCFTDLLNLPHLLIAGSTGSGKSVALNGMLMSLLYKVTPEQCKLILIDPKRLEFASYVDIPHLLVPPVTQPRQASLVLRWLVHEMEERYQLLADNGVKNISDYHQIKKGELPFIVVVIDELADLMMVAGREIEDLIVRLAQMARAAGIHLIVATQRPSVDVITGLIKVNFPSRIALRVTSATDSRTILDCSGAEKLVGKGDMLFLEAQSAFLKRVHGAYVTDADIEKLTHYLRAQQQPNYLSFETLLVNKKEEQECDDELYHDVLKFLQEAEEISISLLQRKFRIGYNRSARIIEMLESQGRIMPSEGGKTRKVIR